MFKLTRCSGSRTKVMIKHPRTVFDIENRFQTVKNLLATLIQTTWRGHVARARYTRLRTAVIRCQWLVRRRKRRARLQRMKEFEAITQKIVLLQKNVRRILAVRAYKKTLNAALTIKKYCNIMCQICITFRVDRTPGNAIQPPSSPGVVGCSCWDIGLAPNICTRRPR